MTPAEGGAPPQAPTTWRRAFRLALPAASPVMLAYLSIGFPAGVMASMAGAPPWLSLFVSLTYYSGAGQFMVPRLWLAGQPLAAIATTVSLTNTRQVLYSAAFSPYFAQVSRPLALLFSATVTDESFGVNLDRLARDPAWDARVATATNLCCMASWAAANALGCALGPIIDVPTALMSFAMTSIFICLAVARPLDSVTMTVMVAATVAVVVLKLVGLGDVAILGGAVCGIAAGMLAEQLLTHGEAEGEAMPR